MHRDPSLADSVSRLAIGIGPALRPIQASFRSRLAALKFTKEQQREIERITPGAAVKAYRAGAGPAEFLRDVGIAGRKLVLLGVDETLVMRALSDYDRIVAAACRKLSPDDRKDAATARSHLHCSIGLVLHQTFSDVIREERDLMQRLAQLEASARSERELSDAFLDETVRYFGASDGSVDNGEAQSRAMSWSFSVGEQTVRLRFSERRSVLPLEARMSEMVAERWHLALLRLRREERLRGMSLRMLEVEELERRRISRELHDDAGQALVVIRLQMEMAEFSIPEGHTELRDRLGEIRELTERTILSVRKLISELSPAVMEQLGMAAAVRQLVNRFRETSESRVRLHIGKLPRLHPRLELVIYRVLQECFTNISQHSAAAHINVSLTSSDGEVRLYVEDDGVGFSVQEGLGRRNCYGLLGIRERVRLLGGVFSVESTPAKDGSQYHTHGTKVMIKLPVTGENLSPDLGSSG